MPLRLRRPGLRAVFVALVITAVLPVAVLVVFSAVNQRAQARRVAGAEAARVGRLAALREDDLLDGGRNMLAGVAELEAVQRPEGEACHRRLAELLPLYPRFANMGVVDTEANLVCSAVTAEEPLNFSHRPWFQRVVSTGAFAVGDYQRGRITGRPSLVFGLPLTDDAGQLRGVAWAALDLRWLQQFAAQVNLPGKPALTLLDRNGTVLAAGPDPGSVGTPFPGALEPGGGVRQGTIERRGLDGTERLYSFTPLGDPENPHAIVSVGIPTSVAYYDANRALWRNLLLLTVITALGIMVARLAANRYILGPTRSLVTVSQRLADGELSSRIGPGYGPGELGAAGRAFDQMATSLESRDAALQQAAAAQTQSEAALSRSAQQLQAIVDNAPALIWMQDAEGRYVLVNRQFEVVRGVKRQDVRGRTARELFGEDFDEELHARDLEPLQSGLPVESEEVLFLADGPHWYISLRFPLQDADGRPYAVCGISTDVTERIQAEAQREALAAQLQQSQRLESLGQLAGGVAHDFNNLLGVIINYADFVLDALPEPGSSDADPLLEGIRSDTQAIFGAAETAAALTRQLLIFGRRDAAHPRILDIAGVVTSVEPLLRRTIGEDVMLHLHLGPQVAKVRADPGRLEQVLLNLAVNARDAMPEGGRLTVNLEELHVDDTAALQRGVVPGRWVCLTVADTGVGMTESVAGRAFEPFFTTKPKGHGTGLGLATVFGIVTEAGGHVSLDSTPGEGTAVHVYLPPVPDDSPAIKEAPAGATPAGSGQTVMLVEDEDVMREVARRILAGHGYSVLTAADASQALKLCEDDDVVIDLILTDVVMPGLSGPDLVHRARAIRPEIRAIYMSGYPEDFVARRHGTDDVTVIHKPFTPGGLLRHVRLALDTT